MFTTTARNSADSFGRLYALKEFKTQDLCARSLNKIVEGVLLWTLSYRPQVFPIHFGTLVSVNTLEAASSPLEHPTFQDPFAGSLKRAFFAVPGYLSPEIESTWFCSPQLPTYCTRKLKRPNLPRSRM